MTCVELDKDNKVVRGVDAIDLTWCRDTLGGNWVEVKKEDITKAEIGTMFLSASKQFMEKAKPTIVPRNKVKWDEKLQQLVPDFDNKEIKI